MAMKLYEIQVPNSPNGGYQVADITPVLERFQPQDWDEQRLALPRIHRAFADAYEQAYNETYTEDAAPVTHQFDNWDEMKLSLGLVRIEEDEMGSLIGWTAPPDGESAQTA